ncbi:hypothetical protein D3C72_1566820 [compost metagenome]
MAIVEGDRGGAGVDQELQRVAVHRTGDPIVPANALGDAQLLRARLGKAFTVFATQGIGALHAIHPQHRAAAVGTDHHHPAGTGLADSHQLALTVDIEHRGTGEQADHQHLGRGPARRASQQQRPGAEYFQPVTQSSHSSFEGIGLPPALEQRAQAALLDQLRHASIVHLGQGPPTRVIGKAQVHR